MWIIVFGFTVPQLTHRTDETIEQYNASSANKYDDYVFDHFNELGTND